MAETPSPQSADELDAALDGLYSNAAIDVLSRSSNASGGNTQQELSYLDLELLHVRTQIAILRGLEQIVAVLTTTR